MAHTPPARKAPARPPIVAVPQAQSADNEPAVTSGPAESSIRRVSLAEAGFVGPTLITRPSGKLKRLMLSLEGDRGTGKSEFACSAPGPGAVLCLDRGIDSVLDNPEPPPTRTGDFVFKAIPVPKASQAENFLEYWKVYRTNLMLALHSTDARTVVIDGDPDSWELQRLAEFKGQLQQVPPLLYTKANAARRALYARCYDSGKIIIATSRIRRVYKTKLNPITGLAEMNNSGNEVREWTGEYEKDGFNDAGYVWTVQCRNLYNEEARKFGLRILECKVNKPMNGQELWGDDCNFETLVSLVFPRVPLGDWGF